MENLDFMQHVDAVSSCSGGSWAASIYMFADLPLDILLGEATDPSLLTLEALKETPAALGNVITQPSRTIAAKLFVSGMEYVDFWMNFVATLILKPFNLDDTSSYMAADDENIERIKAENPQLARARFQAPMPGRPKTFVMMGALLAPTGYLASGKSVVALEMSPDYVGSPFYPEDHMVNYEPLPGQSWPSLDGLLVGGGLVESFAFGGKEPVQQMAESQPVTIAASQEPFSLAKAVGVSSNGPASTFTQSSAQQRLTALNALADYWPIASGDQSSGSQHSMTYQLGDGGNLDNSALLQMLQRGAEKVIVVCSTDLPLPVEDFCGMSSVEEMSAFVERTKGKPGELEWTTRASFGFYAVDDVPGQFLTHNQVFKQEDLAPMLCEMQQRGKEGAPLVARRNLRVQQNDWWGIEEYDTTVIFMYNGKVANFEAELPADTQANLNGGSDFKNYPFYSLFFQTELDPLALSNSQVNLLAAQSEYCIVKNAQLIQELLAIDNTDLASNKVEIGSNSAFMLLLSVMAMGSLLGAAVVALRAGRRSSVRVPSEPLLG